MERPPFFYAYATMWLHLIGGTLLLGVWGTQPLSQLATSMVVSSFCMAIVVYGVLSRGFGLLLNLGSYTASMVRIFHPSHLDSVFLVAAIVTALASAYLLLAREYRRYGEAVCGESTGAGVPAWISITMGMVVLLLSLFALTLV